VDAIITDVTQVYIDLRESLRGMPLASRSPSLNGDPRIANYALEMSRQDRTFLWKTPRFWAPLVFARRTLSRGYIEQVRGPLDPAAAARKSLSPRFVQGYWGRAVMSYARLLLRLFPPRP
jgi:hypothetical protein